jgi:hypothetical protein
MMERREFVVTLALAMLGARGTEGGWERLPIGLSGP